MYGVRELLEQLRCKTTIAAKEYSRPGSSYVVSREFPPRPGSQMGGRLPTASRQSRPIDILEEDRAGLDVLTCLRLVGRQHVDLDVEKIIDNLYMTLTVFLSPFAVSTKLRLFRRNIQQCLDPLHGEIVDRSPRWRSWGVD